MFNLIEEKWIPVRCESGVIRKISPWEIAMEKDVPMKVAFNRPDFDSSVTQFLIGVVQTVMTPADEDEWADMIEKPPNSEALRASLSAISGNFELYGGSHDFMQDSRIGNTESKPSLSMIITNPGENTLKLNKDFFIKRYSEESSLCESCIAAALMTMQAMAPMGGQGYRTSIRGGSAITVLAVGKTLWQTVCLNILTKERLRRTGADNPDSEVFPWVSESPMGEKIHPQGHNPLTAYWATVRRIKLGDFSDGVCNVCGGVGKCVREYKEVNKGNEYVLWTHPLSPTYVSKEDKTQLPLQMKPGIRHFNQWSALAYEGVSSIQPSLNIQQVIREKEFVKDITGTRLRLWITGYETKQAMPLAWDDVIVPVFAGSSEYGESFITLVKWMITTANKTRGYLSQSLKKATNGMDSASLEEQYWNRCDAEFTVITCEYRGEDVIDLLKDWVKSIRGFALESFDSLTDSVSIECYGDMVLERTKLLRSLSEKSLLKEVLE